MKSIYVSTATLDDEETETALVNLFEAASYPERIHVGLSCSTTSKKFFKKISKVAENKNIKILYTKLSKSNIETYGTGQARVKAFSMYNDEDYVLQCDSHTHFEKGWDEYLIDLFEEAKQSLNHDKVVLTAYLGPYNYNSDGVNIITAEARYPFYISGFFNDTYAKWTDKPLSEIGHSKKFYPCVKFNGNFAFGDKEFAKNPGTYKDAFFYDEEIIQGINLINSGFYMVFPNVDLPITHLYSGHINEFGGKRNYFTQYISEKDNIYLHELAQKKYVALVNNTDYVKLYEEYAKINLRVGLYKDNYYIPERY
jgi:hypothetical protein